MLVWFLLRILFKRFFMKFPTIFGATALVLTSTSVFSHDQETPVLPTDHAPISVMGDHMHKAGEWMMSYRYMHMDMSGNLDDTQKLTTQDIHAGFMVAPKDMTMEMHMLGAMYAPSDSITYMIMLPYLDNSMTLENRMLGEFSSSSRGLGDVKVSALMSLPFALSGKAHAGLGISLPTGSIDEKASVPMMMGGMRMSREITLPYRMQLGSGSYDLLPSLTYNNHHGNCAWGGQINAVIRLDKNGANYHLGDKAQLQTWTAYNLNHKLSVAGRLSVTRQTNIKGQDSRISTEMQMSGMGTPMTVKSVPTAQTNLYAGTQGTASLGLNYLMSSGHRLAFEYSFPTYQKLDGPQMKLYSTLTLGWQKGF